MRSFALPRLGRYGELVEDLLLSLTDAFHKADYNRYELFVLRSGIEKLLQQWEAAAQTDPKVEKCRNELRSLLEEVFGSVGAPTE